MLTNKIVIQALGRDMPLRNLVDSIYNDSDADLFELRLERALIRDIVYRETYIEPTIRDLYNNGLDHVVDNMVAAHSDDEFSQYLTFQGKEHLTALKAAIGIVSNLIQSMQKHAPYDTAIQALKHEYSHRLIDYHPKDDGVDHINVYSKGKTKIGRLASNFAHTPFLHPTYGHFASIEAFWYWLLLGKTENEIRGLYGYKAKQYGLSVKLDPKVVADTGSSADFRIAVKEALLCKFEQHAESRELLAISTLPLVHYYCWGDPGGEYRITFPKKHTWITDYITQIRSYLNRNAYCVLLAGEKTNDDIFAIEKAYAENDLQAVQFVGIQSSAPSAASYLSKKLEIPLTLIKPDEEKYAKAAIYQANTEAIANSTAALVVLHDPVTSVTKDLLDKVEKEEEYIFVGFHPAKNQP